MGKITKRIVFGALMLVLLTALLLADRMTEGVYLAGRNYPGLILMVMIGLMAYVAFGEMSRLAGGAGVKTLRSGGLAATILLIVAPMWTTALHNPNAFFVPEMAFVGLGVALVFAEQMIRHRKQDAIRQLACTLLTVAYIGGCGAAILWLRLLYGIEVLVLFLVAVKCTDIGAFFTGTAIGKHKMIPWLSPGKSWEGLAGGVVFAAVITLLVRWLLRVEMGVTQTIIFAVVLGLIGQFGDLCESLLKRSADLKDSGALVPEFGGILDMIDSPLIAAPAALFLLPALV